MTECERIVAQGVLPQSFFDEEKICDFVVTKERKKIWAVLLDLLIAFDAVCKKHGLTYYLTDGTLLGAIRHKGFIPWDDDIDVAMPRADYEKLQALAKEFLFPYFLQTPYTDPGFFYSYIKIRNSNTTGMSKACRYQGFNEGLFIDVFPMDAVNIEKGEEVYNKLRELCLSNSAYMKLSNPNFTPVEKENFRKIASKDPLKTYSDICKLATQFNEDPGQWISHWVTTISPYSKRVWYREDFEKVLYWEFEGMHFPVPVGYDRYLRIVYGDYFQLPSIEQRGRKHDNTIFDPDHPYTDYQTKV